MAKFRSKKYNVYLKNSLIIVQIYVNMYTTKGEHPRKNKEENKMRKIDAFENTKIKALKRAYSLARENEASILIFNQVTSKEDIEGIAKACREQEVSIAIADRFEYDLDEEVRKFEAAGFSEAGWMSVSTEMIDEFRPRVEQAMQMRI